MFKLDEAPGRTCLINDKEFLFFSGYSYLGMNHITQFTDLVKQGIDKYGVLFPSSRISNTQLKLYEEFENALSQLTGLQQTVSFSSGFLAGQTIANILSGYKNIFVSPNTHPAIKIITSQNKHSSFNEWSSDVLNKINNSNEKEFVLVADSVNIMQSIVYDFSFLKKIESDKKIIVLIDDSHSIGILGKNGEGIISQLPAHENIEYIITYSLSKAFNVEGGAVSCSQYFADILQRHPNYTASTSINPSLAFAFIKAKDLYTTQRKQLRDNIEYINKNLAVNLLCKNQFALPIFIARQNSAETFFENNIIISSFNYPSPQSDKIDRAIVSALHTENDLEKLLSVH
jgi:7-keto-8-aminopelargonate synthetase-like enzyme